jgi:transposase
MAGSVAASFGLDAKDAVFLAALASGATQVEAANRAGMSESTARRRLKDPRFRAELERLRSETIRAVSDELLAVGRRAVSTLGELQDASVPAGTRLGAARAVLDLLVRYQQTAEFDERLRSLEAAVADEHPEAAWSRAN